MKVDCFEHPIKYYLSGGRKNTVDAFDGEYDTSNVANDDRNEYYCPYKFKKNRQYNKNIFTYVWFLKN